MRGSAPIQTLLRSNAGVSAIVGLVCWFAYTVWVLFAYFDRQLESIIASVIATAFSALFAFYSWKLSKKPELDVRIRRSWRVLAFAGLSNIFGEIFWFYYENVLHVSPFVTIADLFYLLYYPLLFAGVLLLPPAPLGRQEKIVLSLDLAIVITVAFTVLWYFILAPLGGMKLDSLKAIVGISYPVGALMVIVGVVALLERDIQRITFWPVFFLGVGMCCSAFADTFFAYFGINNIPYVQGYLNIFWILGSLFLLLAVACQDAAKPTDLQGTALGRSSRVAVILPYLCFCVGIMFLVLIINSLGVSGLHLYGVLLGVLVLFSLIVLRQDVLRRENARLYEQMQQLAITDTLTGVYNRHFANETIERELLRAQRSVRALSILLVDVDGFKQYNDTFGHLSGDVVLKMIADKLKSQLRSTDIIGRFGGDEFIAILPETDRCGAEVVAEKMKQELGTASFSGMTLGVTIGVATYIPGRSAGQLIEEADRELYRMKNARPQL